MALTRLSSVYLMIAAPDRCVSSGGCNRLIQVAGQLDELDAAVGDGDCGSTMKGCAKTMLALLQQHQVPADPSAMCAFLVRSIAGSRVMWFLHAACRHERLGKLWAVHQELSIVFYLLP
jgi:hypothetical protein